MNSVNVFPLLVFLVFICTRTRKPFIKIISCYMCTFIVHIYILVYIDVAGGDDDDDVDECRLCRVMLLLTDVCCLLYSGVLRY